MHAFIRLKDLITRVSSSAKEMQIMRLDVKHHWVDISVFTLAMLNKKKN